MSITFERLLPPPYIRPPQIPAGVFSFAFHSIRFQSGGPGDDHFTPQVLPFPLPHK